ncbi:hypothetical protein ACWEVP_21135 [Amycolatopsis sp. NPDC003865]
MSAKAIFLAAGVAALAFAGLLSFPLYAVLAWAVMSAMAGTAAWQWADESAARLRLGSAARVGVVSAAATFAGGVLAAEVLSWCGFLPGSAVLAALASAGWWAGKRSSTGRGGGRRITVRSTVPGLDLAELCLVWRRSDEELRLVSDDDPARPQLAAVRRLLLDDMERRNPAGFRRWLDSGALAGSDPRPFLGGKPGLVEPGGVG